MSSAAQQSDRNPRVVAFEIGDRVRLRLHPRWLGTVVARTFRHYIVDWDDHGPETMHAELLELTAAASEKDRTQAPGIG